MLQIDLACICANFIILSVKQIFRTCPSKNTSCKYVGEMSRALQGEDLKVLNVSDAVLEIYKARAYMWNTNDTFVIAENYLCSNICFLSDECFV